LLLLYFDLTILEKKNVFKDKSVTNVILLQDELNSGKPDVPYIKVNICFCLLLLLYFYLTIPEEKNDFRVKKVIIFEE
jgi:hypothetical protein